MAEEAKNKQARYIEIDRRQLLMRVVDVEKLIAWDHPARNIWELLGRLDLSEFERDCQAVEGHAGRCSWSPRLLIGMWIYAYSRGLSSAREISRQCEYEPALQWLTGMEVVNHHTLSDFRVRHEQSLRELFCQVLGLLTMQGLVTLERVAQDGTKIRAHVNKKTFSRRAKLREHLALARAQVEQLERQSRQDEQITRRERAARERAARERIWKLEQALTEIEQLQRAQKRREKEERASTSDPEARFMWTSDAGVAPSYNVQLVTDAAHGLIVDVDVVNDPQDSEQLVPAMERIRQARQHYPRDVLADGGYTNHRSITALSERGIHYYGTWSGRNHKASTENLRGKGYHWSRFTFDEEACEFICPEGQRLRHRNVRELGPGHELHVFAAAAQDCCACSAKPECCPGARIGKHGRTVSVDVPHPAVYEFEERMATAAGQAIYKQRAPLAEFPNAWIKTKFGLRRFRCCGLRKVRCEAIWAALTYNLQRFFKLRQPLAA